VTGARAFGFESVAGLDPVEWMVAMMADPGKWREERFIRVTHAGLREAAALPPGKDPTHPDAYSFRELAQSEGFLKARGQGPREAPPGREAKLDPIEREISTLYDTLSTVAAIYSGEALKMVPHPTDPAASWFSIADLDKIDAAPVQRIKTLTAALVIAYKDGDRANVQASALALNQATLRARARRLSGGQGPAEGGPLHQAESPSAWPWILYLFGFSGLITSFPPRPPPTDWLGPAPHPRPGGLPHPRLRVVT
jgi:hypothetical protein